MVYTSIANVNMLCSAKNQGFPPVSKNQVKIFGKTMTEAELAYAFQIRGYPSTVFMTEELQPYQPVAGYIPAKEFLQMLKQFNEDS